MTKLDMPTVAQLLVESRVDVTHTDQRASVPSPALGFGYGGPPSVDHQRAYLLDELIIEPVSRGGLGRRKQHRRHE